MFRKPQFLLLLVAIASIGAFVVSYRDAHTEDTNSKPEIHMEETEIKISIDDPQEAIFEGVTAIDKEDGDVTDSMVIESQSNIIDHAYRSVVIAAFDSNGHVAKATRTVHYSDYRSPRFKLTAPLMTPATQTSSVLKGIEVKDVLDGKISDQVQIITSKKPSTDVTENYDVSLMVTNSAGDTVELPVTLTCYTAADKANAPVITLDSYLIYVKKGSAKPDALQYLSQVTTEGRSWDYNKTEKNFHLAPDRFGNELELRDMEEAFKLEEMSINNPVDTKKPGIYEITYAVQKYRDNQAGITRLIVVVTDKHGNLPIIKPEEETEEIDKTAGANNNAEPNGIEIDKTAGANNDAKPTADKTNKTNKPENPAGANNI